MKIKCIDTYNQSNLTLNKVYETDLDKSKEHSKIMNADLYLLKNDNGEIHGYLKNCFIFVNNIEDILQSLKQKRKRRRYRKNKKSMIYDLSYLNKLQEEYLKTNDTDFRILTGNKEFDKLFENGIPTKHINKLNIK